MKVFISHSSHDKAFVRVLKQFLFVNGIDTWLDQDELQLGDKLIDKLESALEESSHFIIVLSPNSVESDWVKYELSKATTLKNTTMNKIIPILWRKCEIPKLISNLLHSDLSNETIFPDGDKISFFTENYKSEFNKILQAVKTSSYVLSLDDKKRLRNNISHVTVKEKTKNDKIKLQAYVEVIGFASRESRSKAIEKLRTQTKIPSLKGTSEIYPVILPSVMKMYLSTLKVGDTILINTPESPDSMGHFLGYYSNSLRICIDPVIRKYLGIETNSLYQFELDSSKRKITFYPA